MSKLPDNIKLVGDETCYISMTLPADLQCNNYKLSAVQIDIRVVRFKIQCDATTF